MGGGQQINWRAEERRFHGSTFRRFLRVSAFHDRALRNAPKTWGPLLRVTRFQARPLPSVRQTKTAWDGKSTWINIYCGRCCFRQVLFRGNLLRLRRCYGNNPLTEVFLQSVWLQSCKKLHVGFPVNSSCFWILGIFQNKVRERGHIDAHTRGLILCLHRVNYDNRAADL